MPTPAQLERMQRHKRIFAAGSLEAVLDQPDGPALLQREAADDQGLITPDGLAHLQALHAYRQQHGVRLGFFFSTDDVILVPGFLGSTLSDTKGPNGLIWIDPTLVLNGAQLSALKLAPADDFANETDADPGVQISAPGAIPVVYDLMRVDLEVRRYAVQIFSFDWRKNIETEAIRLAALIRTRLGQPPRPLHVVAHSQGTLVARRAIQLLGADDARRLVNNLVLVGPASFGTFAAAFAIAGSHESIETLQQLGVQLPDDFEATLQSFTGLYQLLPWKADTVLDGFDPNVMDVASFWQTGADGKRLKFGFGWGANVDTTFFNDRTAIVLGDQPTVGAVKFNSAKKLVADGATVPGDGTVPDKCAMLPGVRTYRAAGGVHMMLPATLSVMSAVRAILRGDAPAVSRVAFAKVGASDVPVLRDPAPARPPTAPVAVPIAKHFAPPPVPLVRRLRVFSFDPLLAMNLDTLRIAEITLEVPWETDGTMSRGPVGEYVEVVDFDPASDCFYRPVDLNHPRLIAQDGLPPAESNPQFHQQMTYAVAMATIDTFEQALGRTALWAPHLELDDEGNVLNTVDEQFVPRLRIYPHAMREANAYYDPARHALLFGYFPSNEQAGGETLPGGTVFACQSFDIVAHETTHALLHGLHRYYLEASNPDLFAFHEAFADAVALFQHFSHVEVIRDQVARSQGHLRVGSQLGLLAQQFGQAIGHRGALRDYLDDKPDPTLLAKTDEPHDRGAILMAALFHAFLNIYEYRSKDLYRIASGGTGVLPDGALLPDLVDRLTIEAAKASDHLLTMCVRALDFVPPVDLTFGDYLRALITADYDLAPNDRGYRVAVIDAFRKWGIYPADVNVLDETALRWRPPEMGAVKELRDLIQNLPYTDWTLRADRRAIFTKMDENAVKARRWLYENARFLHDGGKSLGLFIFGKGFQSIPRNKRNAPRFEIHSLRPCCRVGPDGQQRIDLVAEVVQRRAGYFDPKVQQTVDNADAPWAFTNKEAKEWQRPLAVKPDFWFRGGCTLIIDPENGVIRYCVRKTITSDARLDRQRTFERAGAMPSLAATYFGAHARSPFAMLHSDEI